ncbi:DUF1102 domain-containing protein [Haloarcula sp. AONF1]
MKRRTLLGSLGLIAAGSAVGTGAFSSVTADRTASVAIAEEDEAFLALTPTESENGLFAENTGSGNQLLLDFNSQPQQDPTLPGGSAQGLGTRSTYEFNRVFEVSNQGSTELFFESSIDASGDDSVDGIEFFVGDNTGDVIDGEDAVVNVGVGNSAEVGVRIDMSDENAASSDPGVIEKANFDAQISTVDESPSGVTVLNEDGSTTGGGGGAG